jgi:hypothetical protein
MNTTEEQTVEQAGEIVAVEAHGSIVLVMLRSEKGWLIPVPFDHRPFSWLLDAEGCRPADLIGRQASYDGGTFKFLD